MAILAYILLTVGLVGVEQLYISLARRYRLFEAQTERSSHTEKAVVRGGGILFFVAALGAIWVDERNQLYFLLGLIVVALTSFLDDLLRVQKRYRLVAQATAVAFLLQQTSIFSHTQWLIIGAFVVGMGVLNAFNFMDGINGMTAFYGFTTIGSLVGWQLFVNATQPSTLLLATGVALIVFGFYNARNQAICFAGDVGSITIGFIILYELLQLIDRQHTPMFLLLLAVYGVDTILTLLYRLYTRQNIFQAHRLHLFQLIVHQKKYTHLTVAGLYSVLQGIINGLVFIAIDWSSLAQASLAILIVASLCTAHVVVRRSLIHKKGRLCEPTFLKLSNAK